MQSSAQNVTDYLKEVPEERKFAFIKLWETILNAIPNGFVETMSYGMIGYVVPHNLYPNGYHYNSKNYC